MLLVGIIYSSQGQILLKNNNLLDGYGDIPQEKVFVHYNTSMVLVGERIYYSVYCLEEETNRLSDLSKIAYVELVGANKRTIFKHKNKIRIWIGKRGFFYSGRSALRQL